ncbi:MAG: metallophosphoesterase family protein [Brevinema sp.]
MKILHTADLHLQNLEHLSLVKTLIRTAEQRRADLILIAGDLFDAQANGRALEAALIPIWESFSGEILIVPGNHDYKYLRDRTELAENAFVASKNPYSVVEFEGVSLLCVPYQPRISLGEIILPDEFIDIIVAHGTFGTKESEYFPIHASDLSNRYRYAALGHYHTWFDKYVNGCFVVNPGAPRQIRKSDHGARCVSLLDTDSWLTERITLPISFMEYKTIAVSVMDSHDEIGDRLVFASNFLRENPNARLKLSIIGSVMYSNISFSQRINLWSEILRSHKIDPSSIEWDLKGLKQISEEVLYSFFARSMIDKIAVENPTELTELAPYLLERLQENYTRYEDRV